MAIKEETRIKFSRDDDDVEEQLKEDKDNLQTAIVKMDQVREENERLKLTLSHVMKDYNSLKMQFNGLIQEDHHHHPKKSPIIQPSDDHESELVSLSLGIFSGDSSSRRDAKKGGFTYESKSQENNTGNRDGLDLGLDWKFHSNDSTEQLSKNLITPDQNSSDGSKEEGNEDVHASRKSPRTSRSGDDDEILQHVPLKKPRVSVRALCNTQTMNDGCQWRKYGQKISKGNPCPRAYYRCTVSSTCPVRKQVQRCVEDMTILITTYEGTHNHPLPPSATTMASATSAAADMLKCGSSASPPGHGVSATSSTSATNFSGFNFTSSDNLNISHFPRATISSSQSHPTVILDLTAPNHHSITPSSNHHNKFPSRYAQSSTMSLDFSSSNSSFDPNTLKIGWESKLHSTNSGASTYYQPSLSNSIQASQKQVAKAITCDPTFQSALAAAITSMVGNNVHGTGFLNKFTQSGNSQQKNLPQFPPLTLPASKSPFE